MDKLKDTANTEGKAYIAGVAKLQQQCPDLANYLAMETDRLNAEHDRIFAGYTDQQYLEEVVYGPKDL
jgi:hypothetical protein